MNLSNLSHKLGGHQIRGLLAEHGIAIPTLLAQLRKALPPLMDDGEERLSPRGKRLARSLYEEIVARDETMKGSAS